MAIATALAVIVTTETVVKTSKKPSNINIQALRKAI
jgi:hypothetical protein